MKKIVIGLGALIILAGAAYFISGRGIPVPSTTSSEKHSVSWQFTQASEDPETGAVMTKVTLVWDGVSYDAGTYWGTCSEMDGSAAASLPLQQGEVSGAFCYYAGAGDEIGVFKEGNGFVLKHGDYQEPAGEGAEFRGNLTALVPIDQ